MELILYTTHCPKCKIVESRLNEKDIVYQECTDVQKMLSLGFDETPVLELQYKDGEKIEHKYLRFGEIIKWIKEN